MADQKLSGLAAAFRTAVAREEDERRAKSEREAQRSTSAEALEAERIAQAQAARVDLIAELVDFGKSLETLQVKKTKGGVSYSRGDSKLIFKPTGNEDRLEISSPETAGSYVERDVTGDWLLTLCTDSRTQYLQLVTDGLEELLVLALGFPRPQEPAPAATPAPVRVSSSGKSRKPTPDPEVRGTVDPNNPPPGSRVKDLTDPFA
jgi:hypothetical protein